MATLNKQSI